MPRVTKLLHRARKAFPDLDLLKILESELNYELSSLRHQDEKNGSFGDFVVEWDSPKSQDVVLRKKCSSGEELAVSALLGRYTFQGDGRLPREALMKICVKKPDMNSILQFDCVASNRGELDFDIQNAHCLLPSKPFDSSTYRGPLFSDLDPSLQNGLRQYLAARGIEKNFANSLLIHLHNKEHGQYMNWLQKLTNMMTKNE
ncbi:mitochondrial glycoprotein family protein [Striga asiatica]|uniref:Mitochondrial glycoprotein family protein n=1 Tax=Striga asiatica TaxID=4170 RepID=A0A5A7NZ80_STRAF|nr:mitochondrial glycoprotein family protein [Striga asiatica]